VDVGRFSEEPERGGNRVVRGQEIGEEGYGHILRHVDPIRNLLPSFPP
jgi:hypothetical protein